MSPNSCHTAQHSFSGLTETPTEKGIPVQSCLAILVQALQQLQAAEEPEDQSEEPGTPAEDEDEAAAEDDDSQGPTAQEPSDQSSSASQD